MDVFDSPLGAALAPARRILLAGAGGGFDIFCGLPLFFALRALGKEVHLANLSFTWLQKSSGRRRSPVWLEVTADSTGPEHYFPELHLCRFLRRQGIETSIHCFERTGVKPLTETYRALTAELAPDAVVLVDGGTDSLMRGDEAGLGTPVEDVASILAASAVECPRKLLVAVGFGVDTFHGVCHADFLRSVAELTGDGGFLGAFSLTREMPSVQAWREAVLDVFRAMPNHPSIVSASVLSAVEGRYGDYHMTHRTQGSELFINPLMGLCWVFQLDAVARRLLYADRVRETESPLELASAIEKFRMEHPDIRKWQTLPF
jgi:hypothetical protein